MNEEINNFHTNKYIKYIIKFNNDKTNEYNKKQNNIKKYYNKKIL